MSVSPAHADPASTAHVPHVEVIVTESFDAGSVARIDDLLTEALALHPAELVVDLAQCPRVDAAAIGLLLDVHRRAFRAGGALMLRSPSGQLRRNLRLARADQVLQVTPPAQPAPGPVTSAKDAPERSANAAAETTTWR